MAFDLFIRFSESTQEIDSLLIKKQNNNCFLILYVYASYFFIL